MYRQSERSIIGQNLKCLVSPPTWQQNTVWDILVECFTLENPEVLVSASLQNPAVMG